MYIPTLTAKPEQRRFTIQSGVLTSISSRQRSAISGHTLPKRTDFGPAIAARQTHLCPSQPHYGLHPTILIRLQSFLAWASLWDRSNLFEFVPRWYSDCTCRLTLTAIPRGFEKEVFTAKSIKAVKDNQENRRVKQLQKLVAAAATTDAILV